MLRDLTTHGSLLSLALALAAGAVGCLGQPADDATESVTGDSDALCAGAKAWAPAVVYTAGTVVSYNGTTYKCIQSHTSLSVWTPDVVPALWQATGSCGGGGSGGSGSSSSSSSGTTSSSSSSSGGGGGGNPGGGATEYAPYFYTWGWGNPAYPFTSLVDLKAKSGLAGVTLAFVLSNGGCAATDEVQQHKADVDAFRAGGGRVKVSFGGANGTYLENACADSHALAQAIKTFVAQTGVTDLDFDVEQGGAMTADINQKRAQGLKEAQDATGIKVAFTLAAIPEDKWGTKGGMTAPSVDVVKAAVSAGVKVSHVNLMVMDYGGYYSSGKAMGQLAESALTDANAQLRGMIPGLTDAGAWAMLGATPMIGQNDVSTETFSLADAQELTSFAKQKHLGLVSFWAINRDQPCASPDLGLCSKVNGGTFDFHKIFKGVL